MSGRLLLASSRSLSTSFSSALLLSLSTTPTHAQTVSDPPQAPLAPSEPPVAPPAADPPAPTPNEPAPPSQAPSITEPTPGPTPAPTPSTDALPQPTPAANGSQPAAPASAAFEPVPEVATPKPQSSSMPRSAAPSAAAVSVAGEPAQPNPEPVKDADASGEGLLGPFRLGVLLGTGLPEVVSFGAQLKLTRFFGAGVNVGLIPTVRIKYYGEAAQKFQEYDVYGHIYPFGGSFFLGAGVGYAQVDGVLVNHFNLAALQPGLMGSVDLTSDATVRTLVLTPQIGFLKIFDVGFAVGFDLGAQIPIAPSEVQFNTVTAGIPGGIPPDVQRDYINPNDEKVRHTLDTVGRTPLPTFSFKVGWFL